MCGEFLFTPPLASETSRDNATASRVGPFRRGMDNLIPIAAASLGLSGSPAIPTNFRRQFDIVRFCPTFFAMGVVIGHCKNNRLWLRSRLRTRWSGVRISLPPRARFRQRSRKCVYLGTACRCARLHCACPSLCPANTDDRQLLDDIWRNPTGLLPVFIYLVTNGNRRAGNHLSLSRDVGKRDGAKGALQSDFSYSKPTTLLSISDA